MTALHFALFFLGFWLGGIVERWLHKPQIVLKIERVKVGDRRAAVLHSETPMRSEMN